MSLPSFNPATLGLRLADPSRDNSELCELARLCPQGERLRFHHERTDAWERCRHYDRAEIHVAEAGNRIVGAGAVAWKRMWLQGQPVPAAYLFDQMVHPAHRRQGIGRMLLDHQIQLTSDCGVRYAHVLEDNLASCRWMERSGFVSHPRPVHYLVMVPALMIGHAKQPVEFLEPIPGDLAHWLDEKLAAKYEFRDATATCGMGLFVLRERPGFEPAATAVLYRHGPKVFVRAPWYFEVLGRILPFVPRAGGRVVSWNVGHLWFRDEAALGALLHGISMHARAAGAQVVLLPMDETDPHLPAVRRRTVNRWLAPARLRVYLHGELAERLCRSPLPLLSSPRDG